MFYIFVQLKVIVEFLNVMVMLKNVINEYFLFSRKEKRAVILLMALLVFLFAVNGLLHHCKGTGRAEYDYSSLKAEIDKFEKDVESYRKKTNTGYRKNFKKSTAVMVQYSGDTVRKKNSYKNYKRWYDTLNVELNTADSSMLVKLRGIGPVLSNRIIKYRNMIGGFYEKKQLLEVYGIRQGLFDSISGYIYADTSKIIKRNINTIEAGKLLYHPYLKRYEAESILAYRRINGGVVKIQDLFDNKVCSRETVQIISRYFDVE